jgi:hypothetical protein
MPILYRSPENLGPEDESVVEIKPPDMIFENDTTYGKPEFFAEELSDGQVTKLLRLLFMILIETGEIAGFERYETAYISLTDIRLYLSSLR